MAEDGQLGGFARGAEPTLTDLLDPIALEARLKEARARRAEVLARREAGRPPGPEAGGARSAPLSLAPRPPTWLDEFDGALDAPEPAPLHEPRPAARIRPVLLTPYADAARPAAPTPGERPPLVASALPAMDDDDQAFAAARPEPSATRRRLPPAALLFVAGLGLGAAAVAVAVRPTPEPPATVAASADTGPSSNVQDAPAPATPAVGDTPAVIAALPTAPSPAARAARPAIVADITLPADLAAPASEPAPPPMAPPDPAIGPLTAAATPAPRPEAAEPETSAPESPPPVAAAASATPLPQRVSIHYPRSAQALAASVQETLRAAGIGDVETMPVGFAIGRSNVRFYHDSDREAAEGASALLADTLDGAPEARDFTDYPTPTVTGRVEIWLAGEPARSTAARQPKATPAPAQVVEAEVADPYTPFAPRDQVREVQRILLDRLQGN